MAGLLGDSWDDPRTMASLQMAAGLMAGAGPSRNPINFGQALSGGLSAYSTALTEEEKRKVLQATAERNKALAERGILPDDPAAIRTFREVEKMTPAQRELFFSTLRGSQYKDIEGVLNQMPVMPGQAPRPLSTLPAEAAAGATLAGAKEGAVQQQRAAWDLTPSYNPQAGQLQYQTREQLLQRLRSGAAAMPGAAPMFQPPAERDASLAGQKTAAQKEAERIAKLTETLPQAQAGVESLSGTLDRMIENAKRLKEHQGLGWITGLSANLNAQAVKGTAAYDAAMLLQNLKDIGVIETMKDLKTLSATGSTGFGQLSEREGSRLENYVKPLQIGMSKSELTNSLDGMLKWAEELKARTRDTFAKEYAPVIKSGGKSIVRSGMYNGRRVNMYSDGSVEYAD